MNTLPWREHPAAREEYLDALAWYESQETGLGDRLADDLDDSIDFIRKWPNAAPRYGHRHKIPQLRRKITDVFPYGIIYLAREEEIIVIAYAHKRRRPGYWRDRLSDA